MTPNEIRERLAEILKGPPATHLRRFKEFEKTLETPVDKEILEALFAAYCAGQDDSGTSSGPEVLMQDPSGNKSTPREPLTIMDNPTEIVVVLIHGIRTAATWQHSIAPLLRDDEHITVIPIGYDYFDLWSFIKPGKNSRSKPITKVQRELRDLLSNTAQGKKLVVVAHSFGTYVITRILAECPDIKIDRLLMCGSIVPSHFEWDNIKADLKRHQCVNEVGTEDIWPVFARFASWGYGATGLTGFKTGRVTDRFFKFGHSDFFKKEHVEKYWKPFIKDGSIVKSDWDSEMPTPPYLLALLSGIPKSLIFGIGTLLALGIPLAIYVARHI